MLHPDLAQTLAEAHLADLHRDAARRRRLPRSAPRRAGVRATYAQRALTLRASAAGWITTHTRPAAEPACCPS